jgi:SAM-dependent methyltransferase
MALWPGNHRQTALNKESGMGISEQILLSFCRTPNEGDYARKGADSTAEDPLKILNHVYPNFDALVAGKRVADFGSGLGRQSIAMVKKHHSTCVGIELHDGSRLEAQQNALKANIPADKISFVPTISSDMLGTFDVVISHNSFEHFGQPEKILETMRGLLKENGVLLITFGPPWLAPYGSHMSFFCRLPWVNVFFSEKTVMAARSKYRNDGAKRYEEVESGLNKMTVARFERIVSAINMRFVQKNYECIRNISALGKLPLLREFFINQVTAVLIKDKA